MLVEIHALQWVLDTALLNRIEISNLDSCAGTFIRRNEVPYGGWHATDPLCVGCGRPEDMGDARSHGGRCAPCAKQYEEGGEAP